MLTSLRISIYRFNKIRRHIGFINAYNVFINWYILKSGNFKLSNFKHPLTVRVDNPADNSTFNEVILRNEYSMHLEFEPKTVIDCGANIGLSAIVFANKYPNSTIVAIEPEENNFNLLQLNTMLYQNIHLKKAAIWSRKAILHIDNKSSLSNAFSVSETDGSREDGINSLTILEIVQEFNWRQIDLLKIDIEGAEKELFACDYDQWIPLVKVMIVETHDRFVKGASKSLFKAISKYNFSCKIKGFNFIFTNEDLK